ncbi:hypothetical protein [Serratia fonticola]|uniref:hypothetical protein n=1 Tax=Serratia fonticola TaxID=47917 RepID=UPI0005876D01|nr:hypothetical protein [Serratia fonticola]MEB7883006.1 hypothetical protein [Serratia fonticola]
MNEVSRVIETQKEAFSQHKFFLHLRNTAIPLEKRLSFLPGMSHFIMSFGDINKYVLPFSDPKDELEKSINKHAKEDANHWPWFITDLQQLHMNESSPFTDVLQYLWSEGLAASRKLTYDLIELMAGKDAKTRLVIIEVMEATGNVMFTTLNEVTAGSSLKLEFCGSLHASHESGHAIGSDDEIINRLSFSEDECQHFTSLVTDGFKAFSRFIDQLDESNTAAKLNE